MKTHLEMDELSELMQYTMTNLKCMNIYVYRSVSTVK